MTVQVKIRLYGRKYGEFGRFEINFDENVIKGVGSREVIFYLPTLLNFIATAVVGTQKTWLKMSCK